MCGGVSAGLGTVRQRSHPRIATDHLQLLQKVTTRHAQKRNCLSQCMSALAVCIALPGSGGSFGIHQAWHIASWRLRDCHHRGFVSFIVSGSWHCVPPCLAVAAVLAFIERGM